MNIWLTIWTVVLVVVVAMFSGLAIVIAIGGFFDIKEMLAKRDETNDHS